LGKNISIYLDDDTLKWLDQLCAVWKMGRSEAIQFVLIHGKAFAKATIPLLEKKSPLRAEELREFMKNAE